MVPNICEIQAVIGKAFPEKVIPLIVGAKHSISILVFDWRWYPNSPASPVQRFNQAILQAHRRGVKVCALVNMYDISEYLRGLGLDVRKVFSKDMLHAKIIIVDDKTVIVGSHNFTASGFSKNFECSIMTTDPDTVLNFKSYFDVIFNHHGDSTTK